MHLTTHFRQLTPPVVSYPIFDTRVKSCMARMILEKIGPLASADDAAQAYRDAEEIGAQMMALARADPPWLEEETLTITDHGDGTYTARGVMNTDKGRRIIVR